MKDVKNNKMKNVKNKNKFMQIKWKKYKNTKSYNQTYIDSNISYQKYYLKQEQNCQTH